MITSEEENICRGRAMDQWEKSLKRPDLDERSRVLGAVDACLRQMLALKLLPLNDLSNAEVERLAILVEEAGEVAQW